LRVLSVGLAVWLLISCSDTPPTIPADPPLQREMPPGFLDEPPPPPTSSTQVLSGGTLVTDSIIEDSVVVLNNGNLVAWGKRGEVDMPNDSVGFDLRGQWIIAGTWQQAVAGTLSAAPPLRPGEPANLLILRRPPPFTDLQDNHLGGRFINGELEFFDTEAND